MRPVNLIPPEDRRQGPRAPMRTGAVSYFLIGGLVLVLGAVTLMVTTSNKIADSQAQIDSLHQREAAAQARVAALKPYADFASTQQARTATVASLATSRFYWQRVLNELALIVPPTVTIQSMAGTANPAVTLEGGEQVELRSEIAGPALSMTGCAVGQDGVAEFIAALQDIDGVTRVGLSDDQKDGATGGSSGATTAVACEGGTHFSIVVAFDDAALAATTAPDGTTPALPATPASSTTTPTGSDQGVADAAQQQADAASSIQQGAQAAESAAASAGN
jgi:Tfp pilus assembly protein PilN